MAGCWAGCLQVTSVLSWKSLFVRTGVSHDVFVCYASSQDGPVTRMPSVLQSKGAPTSPGAPQAKIVYLVRHAEALHNVEEKRAVKRSMMECGDKCQAEKARKEVLKNGRFLDARLSNRGQEQVKAQAHTFHQLLEETSYPMPEVVYTSPLERALQTTNLLFPEHEHVIALELLREKRTGLPCDERRPATQVQVGFPLVDFSDILARDAVDSSGYEFKKTLVEDNVAVARRASRLLDLLQQQDQRSIAVVTHKGFLRELHNGQWGRHLEADGACCSKVFGNAEVRVCELRWLDEEDGTNEWVKSFGEDTDPQLSLSFHSQIYERSLNSVLSQHRIVSTSLGASWFSHRRWGLKPARAVAPAMAIGSSPTTDTQEPCLRTEVQQCWQDMVCRLGAAPEFALVVCRSDVKGADLATHLRPLAGKATVIGGSSASGMLTQAGATPIGIIGFRGLVRSCGIGVAVGADEAKTAIQAGERAARMATAAMRDADLLFVATAPNQEERVLCGIRKVCHESVPIYGGTTSGDASWRAGDGSRNWQLFGTADAWEVHTNSVVVVAMSLQCGVRMHWSLANFYGPTQHCGRVTKAHDRTIFEIDDKPAAHVLDRWLDGALGDRIRGGDVVREGARYPLAKIRGTHPHLVQARSIDEQGAVTCFSKVDEGDIRLLHYKPCEFYAAIASALHQAKEAAGFQASGALVELSEGVAHGQEELDSLADQLASEMPDFVCVFTHGVLAMTRSGARHCNLGINIALFGCDDDLAS